MSDNILDFALIDNAKAIATALYHQGVNVTAIEDGTKKPSYQWKNGETNDIDTRQTKSRVLGGGYGSLPWRGYWNKRQDRRVAPATRAGVVHSSAVGQWRAFDIDACKSDGGEKIPVSQGVVLTILAAMGLPEGYPWALRSGSGAGWHIFFRCEDALPEGALVEKDKERGVFSGLPHVPGDFDHIELRWHGCQTVPAFSSAGDVPDEPPVCVPVDAVVRGFFAVGKSKPLPHQNAPQAPRSHSPYNDDTKEQVKAALGIEDVATRLYGEGVREGNELRFLGNGGLMVNPEEQIFFCYRDEQGGDVFDLLAYHRYGSVLNGDKERFKEVLREAATLAGIELPKASAPRHHRRATTTTSSSRPGAGTSAGNGTSRDAGVPGVDLGEKLGLFDLDFVGRCAQAGDQGDAQLLEALYNGTLVYDVREKAWYVWRGHYWRKDTVGTVRRLLSGQVLGQYLMAAAQFNLIVKELQGTEDENEEADLKEAKAALSACYAKVTKLNHTSGTKNAITFAECYLPFEGAWDAQPYKLACQNGVVDLRTGTLEHGKPEDYIRTAAPVAYDPDAKCPRFEQFVSEILPDQDTAAYLQRLLGYGISGLTTEHILPVLWGPGGRNGKDVLIRAIQAAMGACAATVHPDVVMGQDRKSGAAEPHKVALQGLRLGFANETREGARLNEEQVKVLTGGGDINARGLHEQLRTFTPTHLLFLITNWLPRASSEDSALWERLRVIKFTQRFVDTPTESNEHQRDSLLAGKLANETAGILRWLVDGFRSYQQQGETPPDSVRVETANMRNENDIIGAFVGDCCVVLPAASVVASRLYEEYRQWCHSSGHKPFSGKRFGQKISARFAKKRTEKGMTYQGVGLLASEAHTPQHQPYIDDIAHSNGVEPVEGEGENVGSVGFEQSFQLYATRNEKVCPNHTYPTFGGDESSDIAHSNGSEGQCRVEDGTETPQPGGEPPRKWSADEIDGKPLRGGQWYYFNIASGKRISPVFGSTEEAEAWYYENVEEQE